MLVSEFKQLLGYFDDTSQTYMMFEFFLTFGDIIL